MHSKKEYKVKIQKLERENRKILDREESIKQKTKDLQQENKYLRKRIKEVLLSRDGWKLKHKEKQEKIKQLKVKISRLGKAKWHHYETWVISLCVLLRVVCNCSYVSISKILKILNSYFHLGLDKTPCPNTIQNWVSKVGLHSLKEAFPEEGGQELRSGVSIIIDESIRLGREKLLLILECPWIKQLKTGLKFTEVKVLYMKGSQSWKGEEIAKVIKDNLLEKGVPIINILSDEGSNLKKAARTLSIPHLPDIGHAIATCLRQTFVKEEQYIGFTKLIGSYTSKGVNQDLSYLCPPKIGKKARFMNQSRVVDWATLLLVNWSKLNKAEIAFFSSLNNYKEIMQTLRICMKAAKIVAVPLKTEGLSTKTLAEIRQKLKQFENQEGYVKTFLTKMAIYLEQYQAFLDDYPKDVCIHVSSDVIESIFGKYKNKANNYALTGLTKLNLELPLFCKTEKEIIQLTQQALESISVTQLGRWVTEHSADNQLIRKLEFRKN